VRGPLDSRSVTRGGVAADGVCAEVEFTMSVAETARARRGAIKRRWAADGGIEYLVRVPRICNAGS